MYYDNVLRPGLLIDSAWARSNQSTQGAKSLGRQLLGEHVRNIVVRAHEWNRKLHSLHHIPNVEMSTIDEAARGYTPGHAPPGCPLRKAMTH